MTFNPKREVNIFLKSFVTSLDFKNIKQVGKSDYFGVKFLRSQVFKLNMICGLSMTHSHTSKIAKWSHILVIPLVGSPKPKFSNSPRDWEKGGQSGDFGWL